MVKAVPRSMVHLLNEQATRLLDRPALWTRHQGTWLPTSWRDYARKVKQFALGLMDLGLKPKDAVGIIGFNREEWLVSDLSAMAIGALPVGLYTTLSPEQVQYVLGHCEARAVVVENAAHLETVLKVKDQLPRLEFLIVMDPLPTPQPGVISYAEVLARGSRLADAEYFARLDAIRPEDLATLIYTSGTTGHPKGVMLSHRNVCWTAVYLSSVHALGDDEVMLSYLPLSHIAEQVASIYGPLWNGIQVYFAESFEKLPENLKEVRPTIFFGVPRVWEKFKARAEGRMQQVTGPRRRLVDWARQVALDYHRTVLSRRLPSIVLEAQYQLAKRLVLQPIKARIGFDRCDLFVTGAAPIALDVLEFFASVDMVVRELYGQSEVTGPTSLNTGDATRLGTLGRPMPGVEVRIADDGEILVRGENVCLGYYKNDEATAELIQHGWLHSGDVGELDSEGYLRITGRKKEIIVTRGGKKTPPATLEGLLKAIPPLGNALVVGDGQLYLVAVLSLDPEKVPGFAREHGWPADPKALSEHAGFRSWLTGRIEAEVNAKVARFETIKRFHVLPHDFTVEGGELTSTLKVRRKVCQQMYAEVIARLYAEGDRESAA